MAHYEGTPSPRLHAPLASSQALALAPTDSFVVVGQMGSYREIRTADGRTGFVHSTSAIQPRTHTPSVARTRVATPEAAERERVSCATVRDPQAALAAGNTQLDADGDGIACEHGHGSAASPAYSPGSGGGPVQVRGYYRRDGTYVRPHTCSRPRSSSRRR